MKIQQNQKKSVKITKERDERRGEIPAFCVTAIFSLHSFVMGYIIRRLFNSKG